MTHQPPLLPIISCLAAEKILAKEPELKADFSRAQAAVSKAKQKGVTRFPQNPGAHSACRSSQYLRACTVLLLLLQRSQ